jgi:hypothetical protein
MKIAPEPLLDTYTHWADKRERTIYGTKEPNLVYAYSDRLDEWDHDKARRAEEYAVRVAMPKTASYYTAMLSYYHDGAAVSLRHIVAGANWATGYPYLVFGYKYEPKPGDAKRLAKYDTIRQQPKPAR